MENKPTKKKAKSVHGKKTKANNYIIPPGLHLPFVEFLAHFEVAENKPIMIVGETGVGKSIFLHIYKKLCEEEWHDEKSKPKIIIENCACFGDKNSDPLIALSELFGYKKGSHRLSLTSNAGDRSDTACKMSLNIWSRGK
jgi:transcriptional regulator with PAS, ATPase and Fis domain